MRVALVLDRFDAGHGGLEHWAFQLAAWLIHRGHEVHIVAAVCDDRLANESLILHSVGVAESRLVLADRMEWCLRQLSVDVIHDLGSGWYYDILQPQFGTKWADHRGNLRSFPWYKRPTYLWKRENRSRLRDACELERRQYARSHGHVIAVSQMTCADLNRFHQVPAERMTVIHNGVDPRRFSPGTSDLHRNALRQTLGVEGQVVLLFAAHNFRLKGLETVIRALQAAGDLRLHLLVTGREASGKWERLAHRLGVARQITFCGIVPQVQPFFAAADAFVQPTFYDPCSLVVLEAAACGLPVVTSRYNGAAELFAHGKNGFVVQNPADPVELAGILKTLLSEETRRQLADAARDSALRNTSHHCFEQIFQIYLEISKSHKERGRPVRGTAPDPTGDPACLD
jgi:UDP-glucose:(heptosyl)LPS alpha-1,3-glucosyltransferase